MPQANEQSSLDRSTTRTWELDLAHAGVVYVRKNRPDKRKRQKIVRFLGRDGTIERFEIRHTIPQPVIEPIVYPTQSQCDAIMDFYLDTCETRSQASILLSARDYSEIVVKRFSFPRQRRVFLWICTAEFILSDVELRSQVRSWNISSWSSDSGQLGFGIAHHKPFKRIEAFTLKVIDDMRGSGSAIFG